MDFEDSAAGGEFIKTDDRLLGGRVRLHQPTEGYRVAIDPVILAASITVSAGERILDAGCGTGAAALCLAVRAPNCRVVGIELDAELVSLARMNVTANGLDDRISIVSGSLDTYATAESGAFDQVMTNPPFYADARHTRSPQTTKATAHGETGLNLDDWIKAVARALKPGGRFTVIHRADRLADLLAALEKQFGAVLIFPLWPKAGVEAKRVLVSAVKGRRTAPRLMPGLVLHEKDGLYSMAAEAVLRGAAPLDLASGSA